MESCWITASPNPTYGLKRRSNRNGWIEGRYRKGRKGGGRKGFPEMSAAMDGRRQAHMDVLVAVSGKPFLPSPKLQTKQARNL
jgi:hypothetical protein